jgi:hypothetical protein
VPFDPDSTAATGRAQQANRLSFRQMGSVHEKFMNRT